MDDLKDPSEENGEAGKLKFTPGGPRPSSKVRMVESERPAEHEESPSFSVSSSTQSNIETDYVFPPGGRRHRSRVHRVHSGGRSQLLAHALRPLRQRQTPGPPDQANWITCAGWMNTTGQPIARLTTTWRVPPAPANQASQLIYFFNGIEPGNGSIIVQPVLQWGDSGADDDGLNRTGPFWTVASWVVGGPDDSATHTPHLRVNPGDTLVGVLNLVSRNANGFIYECEFQGIQGTTILTPEISELVWCMQTLEAYELQGVHNPPYDLDSETEYPATDSVPFEAINILTNIVSPPGSWAPDNIVSTYGEYTSISVDASTNGSVMIHLGQ